MHISLSNQRNTYIAEHMRAQTDAEKVFYENVVMFVDTLIKSTGIDTIDCIPNDKVLLSGMNVQSIIDQIGTTDIFKTDDWYEFNDPGNELIIVGYNGQFDVMDDRVTRSKFNGKTNHYGATLRAWYMLLVPKGYSLVACDSLGQVAFFVKTVPANIHGVNDLRLLYRSLHATLAANEYYEPTDEPWEHASDIISGGSHLGPTL